MALLKKLTIEARRQWLMPIILATQEAKIRRISVQSHPGQLVRKTLSRKKTLHKNGLVEWSKVKALSSSPSTTKKKLTIELLCDPAIPFLGIFPRELKTGT
jgi:hypothetical protein